jgi:tol-pal system protein YbgF
MIRRLILRPPRSIVLLAFVVMTLPAPAALAQDRAMQDRLDRLERDLSMLQRQVYRGGPAQVVSAGSAGAVDAELRMDRLEAQMRELTGRVEDAVNGVEQLRRRLEQINSDIDLRFSQNQGQGQVPGQAPPPRNSAPSAHAPAGITDSTAGQFATRGPSPTANSGRSRLATDPVPPGTLVPPPPDRPGGAGTLTPPGTAPAAAPSLRQSGPDALNGATAGNLRPPSAGELPAGSASAEYNAAFGLVKQADYPAAEQALKTFIAQHSKDALAGSAQYWLGETYYARERYSEAASAFAEGYKNYPRGAKAADGLLKLGMSLARANQKQNACVAFAQLEHDFPNPGSSIKEHSVAEKKRLGC